MVPTALILLLAATSASEGRECSAACSPETGFCEGAGKCRCKPGWEGENCDRCITFPGCLHGGCNSAWKCVCEEGWEGSLCDQEVLPCSSAPCEGNSTCVEAEGGGHLCICRHGYSGAQCQMKTKCGPDSAPCQNGGTCSDHDEDLICTCPPGFSGSTCNDSLDSCGSGPCANGGTCSPGPDGSFSCLCPRRFGGATCARRGRPRVRARLGGVRPSDRSAPEDQFSLTAPHTFHKLLPPLDRDVMKVTLKEALQERAVLVTHGQLVCFGMLALLTCLVVLGATAIVFFGRIETWVANARYSQLVRRQRHHVLREVGGSSPDEAEHSVNVILPERIRLAGFGKHYTSI